MFFFLSKLATFLLLPPGLFIILLGLAFLLILRGRRRLGLGLGLGSLALLVVLSLGPVADALLLPLENAYPALDLASGAPGLEEGSPVVVLGGGSIDRSPEEGFHASLDPEAEKRLVYGAGLASRTGRSLVFSGGVVYPGRGIESEAEAARRFLAREGYQGRVEFEDSSRTTWENAAGVARRFGVQKVILVTSAYHMARSVLAFRRAGIACLAAPTDYKVDRTPASLAWCLPSMEALRLSWKALHEYLGLAGYTIGA